MIWTKAGDLVTGRDGHNSIFDGSNFLIVGGIGTFKTEKCAFSDNQVNCTVQNPELTSYSYYPELFMVSAEYCKTLP